MATNVPLLTGIIESIIPQNGGGTSGDVTKVYVDTQDQYILQQANTYTNQQLSLKELPTISPELENNILTVESQTAKWKPLPKLTSTIFIPVVGDFDTALRNAINNAVQGDVLDFTGWTDIHYIDSSLGTVNIDKPLTLLFGNITIKFKARGRTSHIFYITSNNVSIIGYGRSSNTDNLNGPTKFIMEIDTGYTNGGYHIKSLGANQLRFEGFDLLGIRSAYNQNEGTFTGAGGIFLEKTDPDSTSSGNNINNLVINNVYIEGTVAHAIYVDTPIISRITNVRVSKAGKHGIYIRGGTSIVIDATYVSSAHLAGFCLQNVAYSSILASAAEFSGVGYWFRSCSAVTLFGSGAENCINKGSGDAIFGSGYSNSRIVNKNGTIIDDCSVDYRDIFRGTSYVISGGRNILLNGPYSINASLIGEAGSTSSLAAHFRIMGNARYIQILSPRTAMSSENTFAGRFDIRIENVGTDYPLDCTIDFNPYTDGSVVPASGKPYVTEYNTADDACPVYNVGKNTLIRWGNTKWSFKRVFDQTQDLFIDFSKYDVFISSGNAPLRNVHLLYTLQNPIRNKTVIILLPPLGSATLSWANTVHMLGGTLSTTLPNAIKIQCIDDVNEIYFITYFQLTMVSPT
ncbi:MAG: right-handed parallel beta-helix repeat-containing protein [Ignavibacteria bacterium]|nr:right-handed parallel beta-helix repeat-containing protein [Ignavibacteria bacterium]